VKIISGIERADGGEILMDGTPVDLGTPHAAQEHGITTVYQDLALCDNLDTVQNLFLGRELRGSWASGRRLARAAMERRAGAVLSDLSVRLPSLDTPVGLLSGGQRQSVAICRAVLQDPRLIVLDEPTAALGVAQRGEVLSLIERLRERGRSVLVVSHDMADVQRVADRVVVLRLGRVAADLRRGAYDRDTLVAAITGAGDAAAGRKEGDDV
jgi:D-xylose transport system ATP-binding protein